MARPLRVEFAGALYHVTARGNERRPVYRDDEDHHIFLATLAQACEEFGLRIHAYCLMPNHYHFLVEPPRANLSRSIGWFQTTYTVRFNRRHRRSGHLFQGRCKAHLVEADNGWDEDFARRKRKHRGARAFALEKCHTMFHHGHDESSISPWARFVSVGCLARGG